MVVDQDLDPQASLPHTAWQPTARGRLREVAGDRLGADAVVAPQFAGERVQAVLAARDQHQSVATGSELAGDGAADPGGRTGDQRSCIR